MHAGNHRVRFVRPAVLCAALLLLGGLAAGCASSSESAPEYSVDQGALAARPLPSVRRAKHHPDSLAHLSLKQENGTITFEHERSYKSLLLEWTSGFGGSAGSAFQDHAMLWSKELSLLSLVPERGIQELSADLARRMIAERTAEYDSLLQIDVYLFAPSRRRRGRTALERLRIDQGARVFLKDGREKTYRPDSIEVDVPLDAYYQGRETLYGRNAVYFKRFRDGRDLLNTDRLELHVGGGRFVWTFPPPSAPPHQ